MKRPLTAFGFTMLTVMLCLCLFHSISIGIVVMCVAFCGLVFCLALKKTRKNLLVLTMLFSVMASCLLFLLNEYKSVQMKSLSNCRQMICATVQGPVQYKKENSRYYLLLETKSVGGENCKTKLRLSFSKEKDKIDLSSFEPGDEVTFSAYIYEIGEGENSIRNYFLSKNIFLGGYSPRSFEVEKAQHHGYIYYSNKLHSYIQNTLLTCFGEEKGGLLISMLTGDKTFVSDNVYSAFQRSGVSHLMAVSGFHLTVWILIVSNILSLCHVNKRKSSMLLMAVVLFVMSVAGFSSSVMRAGFMMLLYLSGPLFEKESDGLNSLGFASIVILLLNGFSCLDIGFILSFLSTLAILVLGFPFSKKVREKADNRISTGKSVFLNNRAVKGVIFAVVESLAVSVSVILFTFPVMLVNFRAISTVSVIANLLFLPVAFPMIISSGLFCVFKAIPVISFVLKFICDILSVYSIKVVTFLSSWKYSYIQLNFDYLKVWLIVALVLVAVAMVFKKYAPKFVGPIIAVIVLSFLFGGYAEIYRSFGAYKITAVDSGGGICVIVSMNGHGVVVGGEGDYYLEIALKEATEFLNVKIDGAIISENGDREKIRNATGCENFVDASVENYSISLFEKIKIFSDGSGVIEIEGNLRKTEIMLTDGLQEEYGCDIIITDNGKRDNSEKTVIYTGENDDHEFSTENLKDITVTVDSRGKYKLRGENSWLSLMKSS